MNWLDIVLIGLVVIGALRGFRIGLLSVAVNIVALTAGWLIASQIAHMLGLVNSSLGWNNASITVAVYVIVIALTVAAIQLAWGAIQRSLGVATLGASSLIDKISGLLLGVVLGGVLAGALVLGLAILAYDARLDNANLPDSSRDVRNVIDQALVESLAVRVFVEQTEGLPLDEYGFIIPGFAESLEMLGRRT